MHEQQPHYFVVAKHYSKQITFKAVAHQSGIFSVGQRHSRAPALSSAATTSG